MCCLILETSGRTPAARLSVMQCKKNRKEGGNPQKGNRSEKSIKSAVAPVEPGVLL